MKNFLTLNNGINVPQLAYDTQLIKNEDAAKCVKTALEVGYQHIDTAQAYGNEEGVGDGIKQSQVEIKDIFVTTKILGEIKTFDEAKNQ